MKTVGYNTQLVTQEIGCYCFMTEKTGSDWLQQNCSLVKVFKHFDSF